MHLSYPKSPELLSTGRELKSYGKIQLSHTNKDNGTKQFSIETFKQIFQFRDIKNNLIGIPFITKYIPTVNLLKIKVLIKRKYK